MSSNAFINSEIWKDDEVIALPLDAKLVYFALLIGERKYIDVFKLHTKVLSVMSGLNEQQLDVSLRVLAEAGFIEVFDGFIGIKKSYAVKLNGFYNDVNSKREYEKLPSAVREHFYPDGEEVIVVVKPKKKKTGPRPDTIDDIINRQPEEIRPALRDFVGDRLERKKTPTTRMVNGWINRLNQLYPNNYAMQSKSVLQSIDRGWQGLFEVHVDKQEKRFM